MSDDREDRLSICRIRSIDDSHPRDQWEDRIHRESEAMKWREEPKQNIIISKLENIESSPKILDDIRVSEGDGLW